MMIVCDSADVFGFSAFRHSNIDFVHAMKEVNKLHSIHSSRSIVKTIVSPKWCLIYRLHVFVVLFRLSFAQQINSLRVCASPTDKNRCDRRYLKRVRPPRSDFDFGSCVCVWICAICVNLNQNEPKTRVRKK